MAAAKKRGRAAKEENPKSEAKKQCLSIRQSLSKRKKDARRVSSSAPLAEAPEGSAIALTPCKGTEAVTPEESQEASREL